MSATVMMERLSSEEVIVLENKEPRRILRDISLRFESGQTWAVSSGVTYEPQLLLEDYGEYPVLRQRPVRPHRTRYDAQKAPRPAPCFLYRRRGHAV